MPCAISGCDMPTAHHRSFIDHLPIRFVSFLPTEKEEDSCVPLECFHILQMRHECFEVLLMESKGTRNTCQLASREDGFTCVQASAFEVLFHNLATRGCMLHVQMCQLCHGNNGYKRCVSDKCFLLEKLWLCVHQNIFSQLKLPGALLAVST